MSRRAALAFVLALALGLVAGLAYAWLVAPVAPAAAPNRLNATDRDLYLRLVAAAYAADGDRDAAMARLAAAGPDAAARLATLLADDLRAGRADAGLARLAADLDAGGAAALLLPPPSLPAATVAATATPPAPQATAAPALVRQQQPLCPGEATRRLVVRVDDAAGAPLSGVAVSTRRGDDATTTAYTGFAAVGDAGTADFALEPGATYALEIGGRVVAEGLGVVACPDGLEGGWQVELALSVED